MFAYLVAGLIVGGLMRYLRHEPGDPPVFVQLVVGCVAAGIGGLALNVVQGEDFLDVNTWGFTTAPIAALVALVFVQSRARGTRPDDATDG